MQSLAFFPAKGDICPACPALISYLLSGIDYHYLNYTGKHGENMMIAISVCLAGEAVRYDGCHKLYAPLKALQNSGMAVPVCPEILGGLPVPRALAEITGGEGCDVWAGTARLPAVTAKMSLMPLNRAHCGHWSICNSGISRM